MVAFLTNSQGNRLMSKAVVVPSHLHTLPFREALTWEEFQLFCTDLLYKQVNCLDSREYVSKGSFQHGIDVYSVSRNDEKFSVAQCKLVKYLGPRQIQEIIDEF